MKRLTLIVIVSVVFLVTFAVGAGDDTSLVAAVAEVKKLAGGMEFTEGPVWLPDKRILVFSDIPNSKLMQWRERDGLSLFRQSAHSNGNILDLQGRLISCQHSARNIIRTESNSSITVLLDKFEGKRFNSPNDVAVRSDGTLWFTDPPWGLWEVNEPAEIPGHWVYKFDPASKQVEAIVKDLAMPNGIVFSSDETRLYIADTGGHDRHPDPEYQQFPAGIHCYTVDKNGQLGKKLFHIGQGSDGMAVDIKGNLYTTNGGSVHIFNADGQKLEQIDVLENPANVCFGGDDFRTLFITARTSLYSIEMKHAGARVKDSK